VSAVDDPRWGGLTQAPADLQAIIDSGRGDVPLKGSEVPLRPVRQPRTDAVVMGRAG
jgi:hypothetical protein